MDSITDVGQVGLGSLSEDFVLWGGVRFHRGVEEDEGGGLHDAGYTTSMVLHVRRLCVLHGGQCGR